MNLPSVEQIKDLHRKHAVNEIVFNNVFVHCEIVTDIATQLIKLNHIKVNKELVVAGSLLHDIGVYKLYNAKGQLDYKNYIKHGIMGYELLKKEGYPEELCRFASHHTGIGITKEDIITQNLPLPKQDFIAETDEELLVMYADEFRSKSKPDKFNSIESYLKHLTVFNKDKIKLFEDMIDKFGKPDLEELSKKYNHSII